MPAWQSGVVEVIVVKYLSPLVKHSVLLTVVWTMVVVEIVRYALLNKCSVCVLLVPLLSSVLTDVLPLDACLDINVRLTGRVFLPVYLIAASTMVAVGEGSCAPFNKCSVYVLLVLLILPSSVSVLVLQWGVPPVTAVKLTKLQGVHFVLQTAVWTMVAVALIRFASSSLFNV